VHPIKYLTAIAIVAATLMAAGRASASARSEHPGIVRNLLCIHRYEGRWDDPGWPYWGGLQMDRNFMRAYGRRFYRRWGTADHWPRWAQLEAGVRGVLARGYQPWPRSGRTCGLL
jgi:hypothetical protein